MALYAKTATAICFAQTILSPAQFPAHSHQFRRYDGPGALLVSQLPQRCGFHLMSQIAYCGNQCIGLISS